MNNSQSEGSLAEKEELNQYNNQSLDESILNLRTNVLTPKEITEISHLLSQTVQELLLRRMELTGIVKNVEEYLDKHFEQIESFNRGGFDRSIGLSHFELIQDEAALFYEAHSPVQNLIILSRQAPETAINGLTWVQKIAHNLPAKQEYFLEILKKIARGVPLDQAKLKHLYIELLKNKSLKPFGPISLEEAMRDGKEVLSSDFKQAWCSDLYLTAESLSMEEMILKRVIDSEIEFMEKKFPELWAKIANGI